tara:strand:+ start:169 stop:459 length:291 start_codon:yes stop_codon:yes gene_type:complete
MNIKLLPNEFTGTGEVKGFLFKKIEENDKFYIYEVNNNGFKHYEVIKRVVVSCFLDFHTKELDPNNSKETYPKSNKFGVTGWTYSMLKNAQNKFNS